MNALSSRISDERVVVKVIEAVAEKRGIDPLEVDEKLNEVIDPEALERLFRDRPNGASRAGGLVIFNFGECEIRIDSDLNVKVIEKNNATDQTN